MKAIKALLFDIERYDRSDLEKMNENELYGLAMRGEVDETKVYTLDEFQDLLNYDSVDVENNWVFFIH